MSIAVQTDMATPALARWDLMKQHIITNTLESVLFPAYLTILLLMLLLLVVVLWILILLLRFGSHELKKEFLEPSVLGDKVQSVTILLQSRKFSQGHIKMESLFTFFISSAFRWRVLVLVSQAVEVMWLPQPPQQEGNRIKV